MSMRQGRLCMMMELVDGDGKKEREREGERKLFLSPFADGVARCEWSVASYIIIHYIVAKWSYQTSKTCRRFDTFRNVDLEPNGDSVAVQYFFK